MHPIVDRLASHQWDLAEVQQLLRGLSSVMADDVEGIRAFDPAPLTLQRNEGVTVAVERR
jgi:hypothetical protein